MKRIVKSNVLNKDDYERRERRKKSFKRNKLKKRTPKQRIAKVEYGSDEHQEAIQMGIFKGPYYDPKECHLHRWKNGTIPCEEKPLDKYFVPQKHRKEYTGRYCTICHKTIHLFSMGRSEQDVLSNHTQNLVNAMKTFVIDESNRIDETETKKPDPKPIRPNFRTIFDVRTVATDEELFVCGMLCKFLVKSDSKSGVIIRELQKQKLDRYILVEDDDGVEHTVNTDFVFPMCLNKENQKMVPVQIPPKRVHKRKSVINIGTRFWFTDKKVEWDQKWNNYNEWRNLQVYLKKFLPEEVEFYQSFTESEKYNHEKQSKLRTYHNWNEGAKSPLESWVKSVGSKRQRFFMPLEHIPKTFFKFVSDDEIEREFKKLKIDVKPSKIKILSFVV